MMNINDYIMENDTIENAIQALKDDLENDLNDIIENMDNSDYLDLINEFSDYNGYTHIYKMNEIDDICGRIYPSEFNDKFDENFNFDDDYFKDDIYGYKSGDDLYYLFEGENDDLINALIDGKISNYETDCIIEEYNDLRDEIENSFEEFKEEKAKQAATDELTKLVNTMILNASSKDIKELIAYIWNING